jgi:enoyl-CoA hydratase
MEFFTLEDKDNYTLITVNRPKALNALSGALLEEMSGLLDSDALKGHRPVVITGSGEKAFVAGADIKELQSLDSSAAAETARKGQAVFQKLQDLPAITIAAINGFCLGGGLELALACDIRYASEQAKLGLPEVSLGIVPGFGGTQRLPRLIGKGKALEYIATAQMVDAATALNDGLVNKVTAPEDLMPEVEGLIKKIRKNGPLAVATAKSIVHDGLEQSQKDGLETEADRFGKLFGGEESTEGMSAFLEKRKAAFK